MNYFARRQTSNAYKQRLIPFGADLVSHALELAARTAWSRHLTLKPEQLLG